MGFMKRTQNFMKRKRKADALYRNVPGAYLKAAEQPVDERKVVFLEATREELSNSLEVMYRVMRDDYGMKVEVLSQGLYRLEQGQLYRHYEELAKEVATARFIVICEASEFVSCLPLRSETDVIQLWHGCGAFKKFGMSTAEKTFGSNRENKLRHPQYNNASVVTVSSPEVKWAYLEALNLEDTPDIVQPLGSSRTDVFFDEEFLENARNEARAIVPAISGKKVIGYAPTFRGRVASATGPDELDIRLMKERLGDEYVLLVKHHPHVKDLPPIPADCADFAFQVTNTMSIETLMIVSDICISDYSSLVFEYSLFERPLIFFAYDRAEYDDWRGFYYDYDEMTPGPIFEDTESVVDYIEHIDDRFDRDAVIAFREKFMSACDGQVTKRICDMALAGEFPARKSGQVEKASQIAFAQRPPEESKREFVRRQVKRVYRTVGRPARDAVEIAALKVVLPLEYAWYARKPVTPGKVILLDSKLETVSRDFAYLRKHLNDRYDFKTKRMTLNKAGMSFSRYIRRCVRLAKELPSAEYVIINDANSVIGSVPMRKKTKVAQLWRGNDALVCWGRDEKLAKKPSLVSRIARERGFQHESLVAVSGEKVRETYVSAMGLGNRADIVKATGMSKADVYFDDAFLDDARQYVEVAFPACLGKKVMLYAPMQRGQGSKAVSPDHIDIRLLRREFGDAYVLFVLHDEKAKIIPPIPDGCDDFAFDVTGVLSDDVLLAAADIGIFDYSMLLFEFALLARPMFFLAYDREQAAETMGFYFGYDDVMPGPIVNTTGELVSAIRECEGSFDPARIVAFAKEYMGLCDGRATRRLCGELFGNGLSDHYKDSLKKLRSRSECLIDVSIVIAAYNAMPWIKEAVESVLSQTYDHDRMELIAVDDCSTDGTWEYLQGVQARYSSLVRCVQLPENSGTPAKPRNTGLGMACGAYVFFLDADDWLHYEAVERMMIHAADWDSDILLVKMKAEGERSVPVVQFAEGSKRNVGDVFESNVIKTFSPLKLYRRTILEGIEFPPFMPEDIPFVLRAYDKAAITSIAADCNYYHVREYDRSVQQSFNTWKQLDSNLEAFADIFGYVEANIEPDRWNSNLMPRLFRRDIHNMLVSALDFPEGERVRYYERIVALAGKYYVPEAYNGIDLEKRLVLDAGLLHDFETLEGIATRCGEECYYDQLAFAYDGASIICEAPFDNGSITCDVTHAVRISCKVNHAEQAGGKKQVALSGDIDASSFAVDGRFAPEALLAARRSSDKLEVSWPCKVVFDGTRDGDSLNRKSHGTWECIADVSDLPLDLPAIDSAAGEMASEDEKKTSAELEEWTFRLLLKCGGYSRYTRLMVNRYDMTLHELFGKEIALADGVTAKFSLVTHGKRRWHLAVTITQ